MSTIAENYEFKLYLEGIKTNFSTVNINTDSNGVTAMVEIPANTTLKDIGPRTRVHIFFKKYNDTNWLLLFDGEVYGFQLSKGHSYNSFMLTCRDISGYLEIMYTYFFGSNNVAEIGTKIIQLHGAAREPVDPITRQVGLNKKNEAINRANSHVGILYSLIDGIISSGGKDDQGVNDFFISLQADRKFKERFYGITDDELDGILDFENLQRMWSRTPFHDLNNARALLARIMSSFYYETSYLSSPYFDDGNIRQIIFKPDNYFFPAPLCNVVFPNMISSVNFSRNFMAEPTRMAVIGDSSLDKGTARQDVLTVMAYSPEETKDLEYKGSLHYGTMPHESKKGIIPAVRRVMSSIQDHGVKFSNPDSREPSDRMISLRYASSYLLSKEQTQNRTLNVSESVFNPHMAVNFPGVVILEPYIFMGVVKSVNHRISSQGTVSTSFTMSHVRLADLELDSETTKEVNKLKSNTTFNWGSLVMSSDQIALARLLGDVEQPYPSWLNTKYKPENIDDTYFDLLGCNSVINDDDGNTTSQTEAIRILYEAYHNYKERGSTSVFTNAISTRPIITEEEFFGTFLRLTESNDMYNSGGYFDSDYQKMIVKYNSRVNFNVGYIT